MNVIASTVICRGTRLLENFSKLVERREAVKLYLAHKLTRFYLLLSLEYLRVPARAHALEIRVPGIYTQLPEIDSRAGATLHVSLALIIKLPMSGTVILT